MLSLAFTFPAGRYHATPFDRHVNEGAVEWPPEPWRLLRALIATWHHKIKHAGQHRESTLSALIESLASDLPHYALPPASCSHTRQYMPQWKAGDTSMVFDAFTAVARDEPLIVTWRDLDLPEDQLSLLDDLLGAINYLGRAESWVEARRVGGMPDVNCMPGTQELDSSTGEIREPITLFAPVPASEYRSVRERFLSDKRTARKLEATLPERLLDALSVETDDLRKQGWSQPPAARKVHYLRPAHALRPQRTSKMDTPQSFTTVRYLIVGKPLPRVEETLRIGELLRQAVMGQAKRVLGEEWVPPLLSGHGLPKGNKHRHAFYLPWDANGDGRLERLLMHVPAGMGPEERRVVERVKRLWSRDGGEWSLVLEGIGSAGVGGKLTNHAMAWQSLTPYLHPWHAKRAFTVEKQILRECRERGLPELIEMQRLEHIAVGGSPRRPVQFHRFRGKHGCTQPDRRGSFWRLTFAEPVAGPLALGFGCHFGLGLFSPMST